MRRGSIAFAAALVAVFAAPRPAAAFSDPEVFADTVTNGGGGGRYFTGSRAEGYACSVCHQGGDAPRFVIDPLPETFVPGTRYDLVVHWDDPTSPQALELELTNSRGTHPTVSVPAPAMLPAESRCGAVATGLPAVSSVDVSGRRIISVEGCGASRVMVSFVADGEPISLAIAGVRSNKSETPDGDGVFEQRITLPQRAGADAGAGVSGCNSGREPTLLVAPLLLVGLAMRGRRSRKLDA